MDRYEKIPDTVGHTCTLTNTCTSHTYKREVVSTKMGDHCIPLRMALRAAFGALSSLTHGILTFDQATKSIQFNKSAIRSDDTRFLHSLHAPKVITVVDINCLYKMQTFCLMYLKGNAQLVVTQCCQLLLRLYACILRNCMHAPINTTYFRTFHRVCARINIRSRNLGRHLRYSKHTHARYIMGVATVVFTTLLDRVTCCLR
jgi:hypothetical protein